MGFLLNNIAGLSPVQAVVVNNNINVVKNRKSFFIIVIFSVYPEHPVLHSGLLYILRTDYNF